MQGVVTTKPSLLTYVGWPGKIHDVRVLKNSRHICEGRKCMPNNRIQSVHRVNVPVVLIDDPAYPLQPWTMEPYIYSGSLISEQLPFNAHFCGARVVVEHTYGWLKGRW